MSAQADIKGLYNPKLTPATLAAYLDPQWIPARHLMYASAKIATTVKRGGGRLIISWPPRHGKSRMLSIGGTTWVLENFARYNVGMCTYGADLSTDFSTQVKQQILQNEDKLLTRIRQGSNRIDRFVTERDNWVFAFGLRGAVIGRGFHVFFLDDFIKNLKEAVSPTYRQEVWDWFLTTALTRMEPGGTIVIIATRWHEDDLIGRILKNEADLWEYIKFQAIAGENDPIGRKPGEALFPERYSLDELLKIKRSLGSYWWSAIYQQDPREDTSKLANKEWLQYVTQAQRPHPNLLKWVRVWDFAGKKKGGDYSVGMLFGGDRAQKKGYIADIVRDQVSPAELDKLFKETAESDGRGVDIKILQEPGASGLITTQHFKTLLPGYNIEGVPEVTNKVAKAHSMLAGAEDRRLYLHYGEWNQTFEDEFDTFPTGEYDDQVDCAAVGWNSVVGITEFSSTWGRSSIQPTGVVVGGENGTITGATWGRSDTHAGLYLPGRLQ